MTDTKTNEEVAFAYGGSLRTWIAMTIAEHRDDLSVTNAEIADAVIAVIVARQPSREEFDEWVRDFIALDPDDDNESVDEFMSRCQVSQNAFDSLLTRALLEEPS